MTRQQFLEKYHDYCVDDETTAVIDAMKIKLSDTDEKVKAVKIRDKYCLMLEGAIDFLNGKETE